MTPPRNKDEQFDALETELRSLKPVQPSAHVAEGIEQSLRSGTWLRIGGGIAAAAALVLLAIFIWPISPQPNQAVPQVAHSQTSTSPDSPRGPDVTAWRYHLVARESPDQLMRLLDQQAAQSPALGGPDASLTLDDLLESPS